jgi:putative phosphoribosyl transferase
VFDDRRDAGRRLADRLAGSGLSRPVILGLPRGGVVVAAEVAARLSAPLDIVVVRKIGSPWQPELGIGAIAEGDLRVMNDPLADDLGLSPDAVEAVVERERVELARRVAQYRRGDSPLRLEGRTAVVVDDGLATGFTALAAIEAARARGAERVVLAAPVAPVESVLELQSSADEVVVLSSPVAFFAIGQFYRDFGQTTDEEVIRLLDAARPPHAGDRPPTVS